MEHPICMCCRMNRAWYLHKCFGVTCVFVGETSSQGEEDYRDFDLSKENGFWCSFCSLPSPCWMLPSIQILIKALTSTSDHNAPFPIATHFRQAFLLFYNGLGIRAVFLVFWGTKYIRAWLHRNKSITSQLMLTHYTRNDEPLNETFKTTSKVGLS